MVFKNKSINLALLFVFLFVGLASASSSETCSLSVSLINQDPYPALPDDYVDVVFQVSGVQNPSCAGAWFELVPSYPFSLDGEETFKTVKGDTYISDSSSAWMISYKLRVDEDALDGAPEVEIHYGPGYRTSAPDTYLNKKFNITVQDSRTIFDAVIQESTSSEVSIALANAGKYVANSVVVRIPEQDNFQVTGTDGQMVGNLDSGDYTIVSFSISSNNQRGMPGESSDEDNNLIFDIYYTDSLGKRRIVEMELPLQMTSALEGDDLATAFEGRIPNRNQFQWSSWYTGAIIVVCLIVAFFVYRKYFKKRLHKKKTDKTKAVPEWVKNNKGKKK